MDREGVSAIGQRGDLEIAEHHSVKAGGLRADLWSGGQGRTIQQRNGEDRAEDEQGKVRTQACGTPLPAEGAGEEISVVHKFLLIWTGRTVSSHRVSLLSVAIDAERADGAVKPAKLRKRSVGRLWALEPALLPGTTH